MWVVDWVGVGTDWQSERSRAHTHTPKHPTKLKVLDPRTRLILFKLLNKGFLATIDGCLSTGKEVSVCFMRACLFRFG